MAVCQREADVLHGAVVRDLAYQLVQSLYVVARSTHRAVVRTVFNFTFDDKETMAQETHNTDAGAVWWTDARVVRVRLRAGACVSVCGFVCDGVCVCNLAAHKHRASGGAVVAALTHVPRDSTGPQGASAARP